MSLHFSFLQLVQVWKSKQEGDESQSHIDCVRSKRHNIFLFLFYPIFFAHKTHTPDDSPKVILYLDPVRKKQS